MIHTIQYLRAIAALMVVWHHARNMLPELKIYFTSGFGASGVDVFFVISGFIMVLTTHDNNIGPLLFIKRRVIRVAPMYWLLTLLMIAGAIFAPDLFKTTQVHPDIVIKSLLFIPHYSKSSPTEIWPILVPGWTLNYEMFFYAVFAISLLIKPSSRIQVLALSFATLVTAGYLFGPLDNPLAVTYTIPILMEFIFGAVIAKLWVSGRLNMQTSASFFFFVCGIFLLVMENRFDELGHGLGSILLVVGALNLKKWRSAVLHGLGNGSYSIYLTHLFTLGLVRFLWMKAFPAPITPFSGLSFMLLSLIVCAMVGWFFYHWIEYPMTKSLHARVGNT